MLVPCFRSVFPKMNHRQLKIETVPGPDGLPDGVKLLLPDFKKLGAGSLLKDADPLSQRQSKSVFD